MSLPFKSIILTITGSSFNDYNSDRIIRSFSILFAVLVDYSRTLDNTGLHLIRYLIRDRVNPLKIKIMKTHQKSLLKSASTVLALILFVLTINGCQKDDLSKVSPAAHQNSSSRSSQNKASNVPSLGMALINIDHQAVKSLSPEYSVTVFSSGVVVFIGKRNVAFTGRSMLSISRETMLEVKKLIQSAYFLSIVPRNESYPDRPFTTTTCTLRQQPTVDAVNGENIYTTKSLTDYNDGNPRALYILRTSVEKILPIQELIAKE